MAITDSELQTYLWTSAVKLRTHIDAGSYKQYIFPLLFFKRLSDVYDEETSKALDISGGDAEYASKPQNHRFIIPDGCHWNDIRQTTNDVGKAIKNTFRAIECANPKKLNDLFGEGDWTNKDRLPDQLLKDIIEHFSTQTLSIENCPEDELGQGYEYLIRKFADDSGHTAQEFYTNRTVVHLMTEILKPQPEETIYDPTCGSGGMLISAIAYLKAHDKEWRNVKIFGQEINALTSAIARMNMFLHGVVDFDIQNNDVLTSPAFIQNDQLKTFDIVVANPPYSIKQWDMLAFSADKYGRNFLGTPPQGRADYAFFQHILKSLNPKTGRCAILFPHGVLFRSEERTMREKLIKADLIECVIGLGKNLFYNSPMEACIVICRTTKDSNRQGKILLINAVKEVTRESSFSWLEEKHIQKIANAYERYEDIQAFAKVVAISEVENNEFSLSIPLYVNTFKNTNNKTQPSVEECISTWLECIKDSHKAYEHLKGLLNES